MAKPAATDAHAISAASRASSATSTTATEPPTESSEGSNGTATDAANGTEKPHDAARNTAMVPKSKHELEQDLKICSINIRGPLYTEKSEKITEVKKIIIEMIIEFKMIAFVI